MSQVATETKNGVVEARITTSRLQDTDVIQDVGTSLIELATAAENKRFLLNLEAVEFMNSTMLGQLIRLTKTCKSQGIQLKACSLKPLIAEVFATVRMGKMIEVYTDVESAIASFSDELGEVEIPTPEQIRQLGIASEQGDRDALFTLGQCYDEGRGVVQDFDVAWRNYREAAELGHSDAQNMLGMSYAFGVHVEQDFGEALKWYQLAAEQGHAGAQYLLGMSYSFGLAGSHNPNAAVSWYRRAAEIGDADAQEQLAVAYLEGSGVAADLEQAVKWYRASAEKGHANAQYSMGWLYANGEGVGQDTEQAIQWYRKAAEQGHVDAKAQLEELAGG